MGHSDDTKIRELVAAVSKAALADGKITQEEAEILEAVQINALIYDQAVDDAKEDGIIDQEEKDTITALKHQILNDAWDIASISEGVSNDELLLLQALLKKLEDSGDDK